jgi:hypothetical protein
MLVIDFSVYPVYDLGVLREECREGRGWGLLKECMILLKFKWFREMFRSSVSPTGTITVLIRDNLLIYNFYIYNSIPIHLLCI